MGAITNGHAAKEATGGLGTRRRVIFLGGQQT